MPIDPKMFHYANTLGIHKGDRVRFQKKPFQYKSVDLGPPEEGTVHLIWLGIEETFDIELDTGLHTSVFPALGDVIEKIEEEE